MTEKTFLTSREKILEILDVVIKDSTNEELEILYKHIETQNKELQYRIYKDFDIKKIQSKNY